MTRSAGEVGAFLTDTRAEARSLPVMTQAQERRGPGTEVLDVPCLYSTAGWRHTSSSRSGAPSKDRSTDTKVGFS